MTTAVLIDGGFFIKRYKSTFGQGKLDAPDVVADKNWLPDDYKAREKRERSEAVNAQKESV